MQITKDYLDASEDELVSSVLHKIDLNKCNISNFVCLSSDFA